MWRNHGKSSCSKLKQIRNRLMILLLAGRTRSWQPCRQHHASVQAQNTQTLGYSLRFQVCTHVFCLLKLVHPALNSHKISSDNMVLKVLVLQAPPFSSHHLANLFNVVFHHLKGQIKRNVKNNRDGMTISCSTLQPQILIVACWYWPWICQPKVASRVARVLLRKRVCSRRDLTSCVSLAISQRDCHEACVS